METTQMMAMHYKYIKNQKRFFTVTSLALSANVVSVTYCINWLILIVKDFINFFFNVYKH